MRDNPRHRRIGRGWRGWELPASPRNSGGTIPEHRSCTHRCRSRAAPGNLRRRRDRRAIGKPHPGRAPPPISANPACDVRCWSVGAISYSHIAKIRREGATRCVPRSQPDYQSCHLLSDSYREINPSRMTGVSGSWQRRTAEKCDGRTANCFPPH